MDIFRIDTFLTLSGRNLDRNFTFLLSAPLNYPGRSACILIKRDYFAANGISVNIKDKVYISMSVNGGNKVLLFAGEAVAVSISATYAEVRAVQSGIAPGAIYETYRGIGYKQAFTYLCPRLDYQAPDPSPEQIVLKGSRYEAFESLLQSLKSALKSPVYCWMLPSGELKIRDNLGGGSTYNVSDALIRASADNWFIFPIPGLEIGDSLSLNSGQTVIVRGITIDTTNKALMKCFIL